MTEERFSLKDFLFNEEKVKYLSGLLLGAWADFPAERFERGVLEKFPELELKERIHWMRQKLEEFLPDDYERALDVLLRALPEELDPTKSDDDFGDFIFAPLSYFVAFNGCSDEYLELSLDALEKMTKRFSVEDAIRYFLNKYPERTFEKMLDWSKSENYHVRRLSSEGLRPKLPWCLAIDFDYKKGVKVLDNLYFDKTRYVTRSAANHLNDVSKINPDLVLDILYKWEKSEKQNYAEMEFIKKHALRTLLKKPYMPALMTLGYEEKAKVINVDFKILNKKIKLGQSLEFSLDFVSGKEQKLLVDYEVIYPSKNSKKSSKVFVLKKFEGKKGEVISLTKKHSFRKMSTKKLYSGEHEIVLRVNGKELSRDVFTLRV